jgi:hypothetical protein
MGPRRAIKRTSSLNSLVRETTCPVHAYSEPTSTLSRAGCGPISNGLFRESSVVPMRSVCPTHSYAELRSTLCRSGATPFDKQAKVESVSALCPVHSYTGLSTVRPPAPGTFGKAQVRLSADGASSVHAHSGQQSCLRPTQATFGRAPSRCELTATLPLSRTGLMSTSRPSSAAPSCHKSHTPSRPPTAPLPLIE